VVKERDLHIGTLRADLAGDQPQVVVMDPERGARVGHLAGGLRKEFIHQSELVPVGGVVVEALGE
jgi:hypothetical protein